MSYCKNLDIDECVNATSNNCAYNQICINNEGGYYCQCSNGYDNSTHCEGQFVGLFCVLQIYNVDINECLEYNDCHQICTNTPGSYNCSCKKGFIINITNECEGSFSVYTLLQFFFFKLKKCVMVLKIKQSSIYIVQKSKPVLMNIIAQKDTNFIQSMYTYNNISA